MRSPANFAPFHEPASSARSCASVDAATVRLVPVVRVVVASWMQTISLSAVR